MIGHNDRIAWGMTNLFGDVQDLYVEKINPENPNQYEVEGLWEEMDVRFEKIEIQGEDEPHVPRVRNTRHEPVISDRGSWSYLNGFQVTFDNDTIGNLELTVLSLRWTALEPGETLRSIFMYSRADSFEEFTEACRYFQSPAQNMVYADVDGNIGYTIAGIIPERRNGHGIAPRMGR